MKEESELSVIAPTGSIVPTINTGQWVWTDPRTCQRCGKHGSMTRHHEKNDGRRTGRYTLLCRDCHNIVEGIIPRHQMTKLIAHGQQCSACGKLLEEIKACQLFDEKKKL